MVTALAMNLAIRIAAAILSLPPDALAPMIPMMAPPPRNGLEMDVRNEVDTALFGSCSSSDDTAPLFVISPEEANFVNCQTGLPSQQGVYESEQDNNAAETYGEVTALGARQLFHIMGLTKMHISKQPNYQFVDLGSGGGRLVMQAHLELPSVFKSVGIELSPSRHKVALNTWNNLVDSGDADRIRKFAERSWGMNADTNNNILSTVELQEGDMFQLDISKATHLYVASLCFSDQMLERLVEKIEREGTSLQIIASLRLLPTLQKDEAQIKHVTLGSNPWQEMVEMSWTKARGDGCPVYFYSVKNLQ